MKTVSFLFSDDIQIDIINVGMPQIDDDDFIDALQDSLGVKQIVEILTRQPTSRFEYHLLIYHVGVVRASVSFS
jgi:hypothetical protein